MPDSRQSPEQPGQTAARLIQEMEEARRLRERHEKAGRAYIATLQREERKERWLRERHAQGSDKLSLSELPRLILFWGFMLMGTFLALAFMLSIIGGIFGLAFG